MFKSRFKKVLVSTLALIMVVGTVSMASGVRVETIKATYGRIKLQHEGRDITHQVNTEYDSPAFVTGGRSYVPVRAIADVLGVKVEWDDATHTANFINVKEKALQLELIEKTEEIEELKKEIKELKEEKSDAKNLTDLQKELNKDFGSFSNLDFDIILKEKANDTIEVSIETSLNNSRDERFWENSSSNREKEDYIKDIVNEVEKEFKKSDIEGSIYDKANRNTLYTFEKKSGSSIKIKDKDFDKEAVEKYAKLALEEDFEDRNLAGMNVKVEDVKFEDGRNKVVYAKVHFADEKTSLARTGTMERMLKNIEEELQKNYDSDIELDVKIYDYKESSTGDLVAEFYGSRYYDNVR